MKKLGFSRKAGNNSPAASSDNPYAQPPATEDPYSNNSNQSSMSSYSKKPPGGLPSGPRVGLPSGPRGGGFAGGPAPRPPASQNTSNYGSSGSGYGSDRHGSGGAIHPANRQQNEDSYNRNQNVSVGPRPPRPGGYGSVGGPGARSDSPRDDPAGGRGGYGGMGRNQPGRTTSGPGSGYGNLERTQSGSTEVVRGELFGGAKDRYNHEGGNAYDPTSQPQLGNQYGQSGVSGASSGPYGGYGEQRELTEEEQEAQMYQDTLYQKKQVKQESAASIQRSLQTMNGIFDVQNETNSRLAQQGESLFNAERNMDMADNYNARGYDKAKELQTVNGSMFSVHLANPFTAKKRAQARDDEVLNRHRAEKEQREETRRNQYAANQMFEDQGNTMSGYSQSTYQRRAPGAENPYAYEDDEEEQQLEDDIEDGLSKLSQGVGMIRMGAMKTRDVLDEQNRIIGRIGDKTDRVDDGVRRNRNELDKIR